LGGAKRQTTPAVRGRRGVKMLAGRSRTRYRMVRFQVRFPYGIGDGTSRITGIL